MPELETLAQGLQALRKLQEHADNTTGIPAPDAAVCRPCMNYAVALMRGGKAAELRHLRCAQAQQWQAEVRAAYRLADQIVPR
jgi:hypothetical protein